MNWKKLIKLMLPIRLRGGERLMALIEGLAGQTMTDSYLSEMYKEAEKAEAKMQGQRKVVEETLKARYGQGVTLKGQEDGRVVLFGFGQQEADYRKICPDASDPTKAVLITDVAGTDVGCDFRVVVPQGVDVKAVERFLDGIVFAGVGYRVETNNTAKQ